MGEKIKLGVIYGLSPAYATSIRMKNLVKQLNVDLTEITPTRFYSRADKILSLLRNCAKVLSLKFNPDIVYANAPLIASSIPAILAKKIKRKPIVVDWDDAYVDFRKYKPKPWEFCYWEHKLIKEADKVIVVSHELVDVASAIRKSKKDIYYIPNGVNKKLFDPTKYRDIRKIVRKKYEVNEDEVVVGFVGTINKTKDGGFAGIEIAKAAYELLVKRKILNLRFLIVGFGGGLVLFKKWVKEHNLQKHFIFTGFIKHIKIPKYISAMDIAVVPIDKHEFSALTRSSCKLKEFMAMEKIVVTVNIGENIYDSNHGRGCILIENNNRIARAIQWILRNMSRAKKIQKNARIIILEKCDYEKLGRALSQLLSI